MPQPTLPPYPVPDLLPPTRGALPLQGLTLLLVEDSRFSSDAMRLMCQRAGARLRRADSLASARAHLRVYRPDAVIIDLGLPDGRGETLIHDLLLSPNRPGLILGTSGSASGRATSLAAGADGYMDKPVSSFASFCTQLRSHLDLSDTASDAPITPDPLALLDDLATAASALQNHPDAAARRYLGGFLLGVARLAQDAPLADASLRLNDPAEDGKVAGLIKARLAMAAPAFERADD